MAKHNEKLYEKDQSQICGIKNHGIGEKKHGTCGTIIKHYKYIIIA